MLGQTIGGIALRETDIAAIIVNLGSFDDQIGSIGKRLRFGERRKGRLVTAQDPIGGGDADQGPAAFGSVGCLGDRCFPGRERLSGSPDFAQEFTTQRIEIEAFGPFRCKCPSLLGKRERRVEPIFRCLRNRGTHESSRRTWVLGAREMFGTQDRICSRIKFRRGLMQGMPPLMCERGIDPIPHERMREQEFLAFRPDHLVPEQARRHVTRIVEESSHEFERELLACDRGGLQGSLVGGEQPIHSRENQRLNGSGNLVGFGAFLCVAEQLFEKQGISIGLVDASLQQLRVGEFQPLPELGGLLRPQRAEINCREPSAHAAPPSVVQRVAFDARRHRQDDPTFGGDFGDGSEGVERRAIGPVQIFDDQHQRPLRAQAAYQLDGDPLPAAGPNRIVHRPVERPQIRRLRNIQQVVQEHPIRRGHKSLTHRIACCLDPVLFRTRGSKREQARNQGPRGIASLAGAEVEHQRGMAGKALLPGEMADRLHQPCLADSCFTADVDDLSMTCFHEIGESSRSAV